MAFAEIMFSKEKTKESEGILII